MLITIIFPHGDDEHNHQHNHDSDNNYVHENNSQNTTVYGTLLNSQTKQPIEYSSVSLFNNQSNKLIAGVISDKDGYFMFSKIIDGEYKIVIEFIGYEQQIINLIVNSTQNSEIDLESIFMTPKSIDSKEVNITGEMPTVEFETDKLVYTPSKDILSTSGSAEDILNNVPMVLVDQDGTVTLKGSSNVKILVNGKENRMGEGGNDVDNIPASMIEKVEVITSPSAKYDPEGMAGIVNIILKKESDSGFNGEIKLYSKTNEYHPFGDMGGLSLSTNYKTKKFNLYSSYSAKVRYRDRVGFRKSYTTFTDPNPYHPLYLIGMESTESDSIYFKWFSSNKKKSNIIRLGGDYYLSDKITINLESRYNAYSASETSTDTIMLPAFEIKKHEEAEAKGNYEGGLSFTADKKFEKPDQELSLFYSYDSHPSDLEYDIIIEGPHNDTTTVSSSLKSQEAKLFYSHPLNNTSKLEMGYDFDQTDNNETMDYFLHVHADDGMDEGQHISGQNIYGYKRDIHGIFLEHSIELNSKWSAKSGLRFEYVDKNISFTGTPDSWYCSEGYDEYNSYSECDNNCSLACVLSPSQTGELGAYAQMLEENDNTDVDDSYTSLYPSFHLTYNITEKRSLQFAISSRVERPGGGHHGGSRQIRPFPREVHADQFIFLGYPQLQPEYSTNYELSYKSPIPMGFFYTNIYFNAVRDKIEWYSDNSYEGFDVVTFRNADEAKSYGLEYFFMVMGQTIGGGFWYNDVQDGSDDTELNSINQGLNMYGKVNLPEKYIKYFGIELGFYYMKMKDEYGSMFGDGGTIWANAGMTKSLLNKRVQISFNADNIFNSGGFSMERTKPLVYGIDYIQAPYTSGQEYTNLNSSRNGRTLSFTIKYNFGKLQKDRQKFRFNDSERGGGMDMGY